MNLADAFEAVADAVPERLGLVQGERRVTWGELDERAARLAAGFEALGLGPDSKVALYLYNCNEYLETLFAAFKMRGVHVNVNYRYLEDELAYLLDNSDAEVVVFHGALGEQVDAVRDRAPRLKGLVQVDDGSAAVDGAIPYEELVAAHDPMPRSERSGDDLWFLYTGGTTGMPKGVMWRHADLYATLAEPLYMVQGEPMPTTPADIGAIAARFAEEGRTPVHVPASPLMHGTGQMSSMQAWVLGGTIVTLESRSFDPHELWRVVERERVTQMAIVGDAFCKPMVQALDEAQARGAPYDLSSLQLIVSSGVMWSAPVKEALLAHHPVLCLDSLGSSEGVGFANSVTAPGEEAQTAKFTIGPHTKVITEDGREVEPGSGERGMLAVGGHIPVGYYKDPEKSAATFREIDGVRYSVPGDWATVEPDGTITLLGRGSATINSGGEKIYPEEVEEAVKSVDGVRDCLVVGVPDDRFGEAVTAVVACEDGAAIDVDTIAKASSNLARYKHPRYVVTVDAIQRGPNGKADYKWAKQVAIEGVAEQR